MTAMDGGVSASGRRDKISEKKVLCISFRSFPGSCTMVVQFVRMCFRRAVAAAAGRSFLSLFMIRYAVCIIWFLLVFRRDIQRQHSCHDDADGLLRFVAQLSAVYNKFSLIFEQSGPLLLRGMALLDWPACWTNNKWALRCCGRIYCTQNGPLMLCWPFCSRVLFLIWRFSMKKWTRHFCQNDIKLLMYLRSR